MTTLEMLHARMQKELWIPVLILATATLLVYSVTFFNGFVMDDEVIIVNNPQTFSLRNIPEVLLAPDLIKPYYRPLNRATYLFDYQVAGMNPAWYHGINILIHLGNVILLYLVCLRLLADWRAALATALIFAVHPANAESVNFISARNTLLALFFSLASLLAWMDARRKGRTVPILSALLFFCGLLSKETGFMMIAVIFFASFMPLQEGEERLSWRGRILALLPYLLLTLVYLVMRDYSLKGIVGTSVPTAGLLGRLAQNYHIIPQYLGLLLVPLDLTLFHKVPGGGLLNPPWYLPVMLLLLAACYLAVRSRNRAAIFGLVWAVVNYAPISNIVPIPSDQITERYLYLPAIGFFILLGVLLRKGLSLPGLEKAVWVGTGIVLVIFAGLTVRRDLDWKNNLALFASGVRNDPESPAAHYNLGTAFLENGDLPAAEREWERTLSLDPRFADALTQMGTLFAIRGDLGTAEQYYLAALKAPPGATDPDKSMAHLNLGKICEKRGEPRQALEHYEQFVKTVPITYLEYKKGAEDRIAFLRGELSTGKRDDAGRPGN